MNATDWIVCLVPLVIGLSSVLLRRIRPARIANIAWCFVAKSTVERVLLPVLCPEAGPTAAPLRVTNNDGTLSNGAKLRGWRYTA